MFGQVVVLLAVRHALAENDLNKALLRCFLGPYKLQGINKRRGLVAPATFTHLCGAKFKMGPGVGGTA